MPRSPICTAVADSGDRSKQIDQSGRGHSGAVINNRNCVRRRACADLFGLRIVTDEGNVEEGRALR